MMSFWTKHFVEQHRHLTDRGDLARDIIIYLLAGAAVLIGILIITYLTTMWIDWLSKRLDETDVTSYDVPTRFDQHDAAMAAAALMASIPEGRSIEDYDRGSISRQANLWGLEITERELILQKIFPTMSFEYNANELPMDVLVKDSTDNDADDCDAPVGPTDIEMTGVSTTNNAILTDANVAPEEAATILSIRGGDATNHECASNDQDASKPEDKDIVVMDDTDHFRLCSICLSSYENGVRVMTGVQCQHMFHESCCQQWLLKHDHCPYCRKNMILATDFRNAAVQTLSPERMVELSVLPTIVTQRRPPPPPRRIIVLSS